MSHASALQALLESGQHDALSMRLQAGLREHPLDAGLWHLQGMAHLQRAELAPAIDALEQAVRLDGNQPRYLSNLGEAYRRAGRLSEARSACAAAVALKPDYRAARYNLACCLLQDDDPVAALEIIRDTRPVDAELLALRADALRKLGRSTEAIVAYRQALRMQPELAHAHTNLGPLLMATGQWHAALEHCRRAVALSPRSLLALNNLGRCLHQLDHLDEAMEVYAEAFDLDPEALQVLCNIAQVWLDCQDAVQAELWLARALDANATSIEAQVLLARAWIQQERHEAARALLKSLHQREPGHMEVNLVIADACWEEGDTEAALRHFQQVAGTRPQLAAVHASIGRVLLSRGDTEAARASFFGALEINPRCVPALHGLATGFAESFSEVHLQETQQLLANELLREGARASLHNALGYHFDRAGDYASAATHIETGNRLHWAHHAKRGWQYDPEAYAAQVDHQIANFDRARLEAMQELGVNSELPVFVVGMPRSGTTLVESILASHAEVVGVGERPFAQQAMQRLARTLGRGDVPLQALSAADRGSVQDAAEWHLGRLRDVAGTTRAPRRIVDKMPDNYNLLAWIASEFPRARIVYCSRDPRDIAVSCWMTQFSAIRWAFDQAHIAARLNAHRRLMLHWFEHLPLPIHRIDYEALVADPEREVRALLDFLDLAWDPNCLQFHKADKLVRTASIAQVRRPIYRGSVDRWRRYEEPLQALFEALDWPSRPGDPPGRQGSRAAA